MCQVGDCDGDGDGDVSVVDDDEDGDGDDYITLHDYILINIPFHFKVTSETSVVPSAHKVSTEV